MAGVRSTTRPGAAATSTEACGGGGNGPTGQGWRWALVRARTPVVSVASTSARSTRWRSRVPRSRDRVATASPPPGAGAVAGAVQPGEEVAGDRLAGGPGRVGLHEALGLEHNPAQRLGDALVLVQLALVAEDSRPLAAGDRAGV